MKTLLGYAAAFLAGAVIAGIGAAWIESGAEPVAERASGNQLASDEHEPITGVPRSLTPAELLELSATHAALPPDFACHPRPGETASEEFHRLLRELVQSPEGERQDRLSLLLARIRQGGRASIPVVMEYLASGRDLSSQVIFGEVALFGGASHYRSLRNLLFPALAQIAEAHPERAAEIAAQGLKQARDAGEALELMTAAARDPATRQQAIKALLRLTDENSVHRNSYSIVAAMVHLQSEELVPVLARLLEEKPFNHYIDCFLAGLWNFPDSTRVKFAERLVASPAVRKAMIAESWLWLDARPPAFRTAIAETFRDNSDEQAQIRYLQKLGQDRDEAQSRFHLGSPIGSPTPRAGAPDSKEQARARLVLLDELAPFSKSPLVQFHLQETRARLAASLAVP